MGVRSAGEDRPCIDVAAGVLCRRAQGHTVFLAAQRPEGKIAAGKWEFPGGKIEQGESPDAALIRELREELGIEVTSYRPLIRIHHAYSDRNVRMWVYRVDGWTGELHGHDDQQLYWGSVAGLRQLDLLGADGPILRALELPVALPITPEALTRAELPDLNHQWRDAGYPLRRLRVPAWTDPDYVDVCQSLGDDLRSWILDRSPEMARHLGAAGYHATAAAMAELTHRPVPESMLFGCSVHTAEDWHAARRLGADYALVSPLFATATHPGVKAIGWGGFAEMTALGSLPAYALGGLAVADAEEAIAAWGQGIAGIRAFIAAN